MTKSIIYACLMLSSFLALAGCTKVGGLGTSDVNHQWGYANGNVNRWHVTVPEEGEWQLAIVANDGKLTHSEYTSTHGHRHLTVFARRDTNEGVIRFAWYRTKYFETADTNEKGETLIDVKWFLVGEGSVPDPFLDHGKLFEARNGAVSDGAVLMAFREHENPREPMAKAGLELKLQLVEK